MKKLEPLKQIKTGTPKLKLRDRKVTEIILNKMLEKYNTTIDEIQELTKDTGGKIDGVDWFTKYTLTKEEHDVWRKWSLNFLRTEVTPRLSPSYLRKNFAWLDLMYGLKVKL